jgi:hypothetical protein
LNCGFLGMTPTSHVSGYKLSVDSTASIVSVGDRRYVSPKRSHVPVTLHDVTVAKVPVEVFTVIEDSIVQDLYYSNSRDAFLVSSNPIHSAYLNNRD